MPTLQQVISDKFVQKLTESKSMTPAKIDQLRVLLAAGKKPKVDDFLKIFSSGEGQIE